MTVKELIEQLQKLEQDKEIKLIENAGTYEYIPTTSCIAYVYEYKNTLHSKYGYETVSDFSNNKDFYILSGEDYEFKEKE